MVVQSNTELLEQIDNGYSPDYTFFWGHTTNSSYVNESCFSQWYPSPFITDGLTFPTAEHYMMWYKAFAFDDQESVRQILESSDPSTAKKLGRSVTNFKESTWNAIKYLVVVKGTRDKFNHHPAMKEFLMATGDAVLVEASPYDKVWGIGMREEDEGVDNPRNWKGANLLGYALMKVRDEFNNPEDE